MPLAGPRPRGRKTVIHLDTSFLIQAELPHTPAAHALAGWLRDRVPLRISLVAWTEYLAGVSRPEQVAHWRALIDGFDGLTDPQCQLAAQLQRLAGGGPARLADGLIAAGAIGAGAALATVNRRDFLPFIDHGLVLALDRERPFERS